ncbi:MAG TPA: hypothetical protein VFC19_25490 [Candidatus Limnocylindrales bacterium]|nr:hypothetical protein [Candidatus Limnocylindrales bacterium]
MSTRVWLLVLVLGGGGGWFLISWGLMGTDPGLAVNEAIGAALGLLLFVSVIGAIRQRRRSVGK